MMRPRGRSNATNTFCELYHRLFNFFRVKNNRAFFKACILLSTLITYAFIKLHYVSPPIQLPKDVENDILYFEATNPRKQFHHLDYINLSKDVAPRGYITIDKAHRQGEIHHGSFMYIIDTTIASYSKTGEYPKILLIKRSNDLVTCPNTWSLAGEHAFRNEAPIETASRGIEEELGTRALEYIVKFGRISNLTEFPVYYERDYGISNGGRVDRQITYLWLVEMNYTSSILDPTIDEGKSELDDLLELDDEAADHKWISLNIFYNLLMKQNDFDSARLTAAKYSLCHETIVSLTIRGMERLMSLMKNKI